MTASFFGGIHNFFQSGAWLVVQTIGAIFIGLLWVATIYWVRKDAKRRIQSPTLVGCATLVGAIPPFLGPLVYMLFRPPEYLEDIRERELEIQAIERRFSSRECPVCHSEVDGDFLVCPICTTKLRQPCANCLRPLESAWLICPYCATAVGPGESTLELWPSRSSTRAPRAPQTSSREGT